MRHSLQSHLVYLENAIQVLKNRLTLAGLTAAEAEDIELQLAQAEGALAHYREAYELEVRLSEPPSSPAGNQENGGFAGREGSKSGKPKGGLTVLGARARKRGGRVRGMVGSAVSRRVLSRVICP